MTREEFIQTIKEKLNLLDEANKLFPVWFEVLKKYDEKRIGEKTQAKIQQELLEKYRVYYRFDGRYLHFSSSDYERNHLKYVSFEKTSKIFTDEGKLNLGNVNDYSINSPYVNLIDLNLEEFCEDIEKQFNEFMEAVNIIEEKEKTMRNKLPIYLGRFSSNIFDLEHLYDEYLRYNPTFR